MGRKLIEILAGFSLVALICAGLFFLLSAIMSDPDPEAGTVMISTNDVSITPVENVVYRTVDKQRTDEEYLVLADVADSLPEIVYNASLTGLFQDGSKNGPFYFTVYDESLVVYEDKKAFFPELSEPGVYVIHTETYWGTEDNNIGMEYLYKVIVK